MSETNVKFKQLHQSPIYLGTDPELFFEQDGEIIGAEKVLPEGGISGASGVGKVIIDGIQAELNPAPSHCREVLATNIARCLFSLKAVADQKKVKLSFKQTVQISQKEMDSLSDKSKQFGCSKSENAHQKDLTTGVKDGATYFYRSAGGHIHIGMPRTTDMYSETYKAFKKEPERLVQMLDIIVGNFCVLIDRDEGNKLRRQTYGRAGEFRLPPHGLEYRTLSNFWLQNYTLMSLVFSLARLAVSIVCNSKDTEIDYEQEILKATDMQDVIKAINDNDFDLARKNYDKIKKILATCSKGTVKNNYYQDPPFTKGNLKLIDKFITGVEVKGLGYWFKEDVVTHWIGRISSTNRPQPSEPYRGWETFLSQVVKPTGYSQKIIKALRESLTN